MKRAATLAAVGFAVVGLAASIASAIDYFAADAAFCAESGCATVRASAWSHPLGVPLPVLGIAFNLVALALCFWPSRFRPLVAIAGGAVGLGLISVQAFAVGAWCKLCLVADPAAIGYAVSVLAGAKVVRSGRWLALPALASALGVLYLWTRPPTNAIVAPRTAGIVEYVDFECPFCREMNTRVTAAIAKVGKPIAIERHMVALPQHPGAMPAAIAWCCANRQGKGDAMADALFELPVEQLTDAHCAEVAERLGCDMTRYRLDAPLAVGDIAVDMMNAKLAGVRGLPTLLVNGNQVVGASASTEQLVAMLAK